MPKNRVQFQKGLSLARFLRDYGTEPQCEQALFHARWPDGLSCPRCGSARFCRLLEGAGRAPPEQRIDRAPRPSRFMVGPRPRPGTVWGAMQAADVSVESGVGNSANP